MKTLRRKLTECEYRQYKELVEYRDTVSEAMQRIVREMTSDIARNRCDTWDQLARLLGFEGEYDAHCKGYRLRLDWLSAEAVAVPIGDGDNED